MKQLYTLAVSLCALQLNAQTNSTATLTGTARTVPDLGYNLNSQTKPAWTNASFRDSVGVLAPAVLRYPGGTLGSYWVWQNGRAIAPNLWCDTTLNAGQRAWCRGLTTVPSPPCTYCNNSFIGSPSNNSIIHRPDEFAVGLQATTAQPLWTLNMISSDLTPEMDLLRRADQLSLSNDRVELGNEYYFEDVDFVRRFPTAGAYARETTRWVDSVKAVNGAARVAVLGGVATATTPSGAPNPDRIRYWTDSLVVNTTNYDAITFHLYYPYNTGSPSITAMLAVPFQQWAVNRPATTDLVPTGKEAWITEYNLNNGNTNVAGSMGHALFTSTMLALFMEDPQVTLITAHQLTGSATFASINSYITTPPDTFNNRITPVGDALRLWYLAARDQITAQKLLFSTNPLITAGATMYPSLLGWHFTGGGRQEMVVINESATTFRLNVSSPVPGEVYYESISHPSNPIQNNQTRQNLTRVLDSTTSSLVDVPPYSVTRISNADFVTAVPARTDRASDLQLYPNPATGGTATLHWPSWDGTPWQARVYSLTGGTVAARASEGATVTLPTQGWAPGVYLIQPMIGGVPQKALRLLVQH